MRKVVFSAEARQDIKNIGRYTANQWGKERADKYILEIRQQIKLIQKLPAIGLDRSQEMERPVFCFMVASHAIYYIYNRHEINIIGILHQNMLPQIHLRTRKTDNE